MQISFDGAVSVWRKRPQCGKVSHSFWLGIHHPDLAAHLAAVLALRAIWACTDGIAESSFCFVCGGTNQPAQAPQPGGTDFARLALVGESFQFQEAVNLIRKVAACNVTVFINGETGTGKELAARAIHYLGGRRNAPFIAVNCGAIADTLIESEFFGHVRGAFTDARESRAGLIAQAAGGTLYLDELEALSPRGQATLLRFLEDQEYRPVGGVAVRNADVRVIASSNVDLMAAAAAGTYRSDLLFRLSVLTVSLPPLRNRPGDARLLADCFIRRLSAQYSRPAKSLDAKALEFLDLLSVARQCPRARKPHPSRVPAGRRIVHIAFGRIDSQWQVCPAGPIRPGDPGRVAVPKS